MRIAGGFKFRNPRKLIDADLEVVLIKKTPATQVPKRYPRYVFGMRKSSGEPFGFASARVVFRLPVLRKLHPHNRSRYVD